MEIAQEIEERKNKRAAANVNERRRMQNINSGFETLRNMIDVQNSAKLSKSAILRHTVEMLRNLISENQQLREQNTFMRNLYCNHARNINSTFPSVSPPKLFKQEPSNPIEDDTLTPLKKPKMTDPPIEDLNNNHLNGNDFNSTAPTHNSVSRKSPKKISSPYAVEKLLASPKRVTRSSVIQQNHACNLPNNYPVLESPTRRSLRLMEKDALLTPPSSNEYMSNTNGNIEDAQRNSIFSSPTTRSKLTLEQKMNGFFTPETVKGIPVRSAKRSLDAIIHAIDQIEKS